MRIVQISAENIKRLRCVDITAAAGLNQVTGRNGHGKTSLLDSIYWALAGKEAIQDVPIRTGAESARVRLNLGEVIVERKFTQKGTTLTVRNAKGAPPDTPDKKLPVYGSPQEMLDDLVGSLSFDPLAFARKKPAEQYDELKRIAKVSVDLEAIERENAEAFKRRTDINRQVKALRAQVDGFRLPEDLPAEPLDVKAILDQIQAAGQHNADIEMRRGRRQQALRDIADHKREQERLEARSREINEQMERRVKELEEQIRAVRQDAAQRISEIQEAARAAVAAADSLNLKLAEAPELPPPIDASELRAQLDKAEATNKLIAKRYEREELRDQAEMLEAAAETITAEIAEREQQRIEALEKAEMPAKELSLAGGRVLLNGLPFEQAADSEQLRYSMLVAMAGNPTLRVIRIRDGSLLDDDSIKLIAELAQGRDYQVWLEKVDSSGKIGIVMEDGMVKANHQLEGATQ